MKSFNLYFVGRKNAEKLIESGIIWVGTYFVHLTL